MTLVDKIEELGAAVDADLLDRPAAIRELALFSDGGLTALGAEDVLENWQTTRATYADIFMDTEMLLAACRTAQGGAA